MCLLTPPHGEDVVVQVTRSKIGTEAKFGSSVASMIWGEQSAIETTTKMDLSDRNHVVHA